MKQLQFEVWQECNSGCDFCYLKSIEFIQHSVPFKIERLKKIQKIIEDVDTYKEYDTISFIGGEFFQGQLNDESVKSAWYDMVDATVRMQKAGYIKQVWLMCSLLIGKQPDLYETLSRLNGNSVVWVVTSYDTKGRFKGKMLQTWESHMKQIKEKFPDVKLNTTCILTQDLIDKYNRGDFTFTELSEKYQTSIFLKPCAVQSNSTIEKIREMKKEHATHDPSFFPSRQSFLEFLYRVKMQEGSVFFEQSIYDVHRRADTLLHLGLDGFTEESDTRVKDQSLQAEAQSNAGDCGHSLYYRIYSDSDECCLCDKYMVGEI